MRHQRRTVGENQHLNKITLLFIETSTESTMRQQLPTNLNVISQGKRAHYHLDRKNTHSWVALLFIYFSVSFHDLCCLMLLLSSSRLGFSTSSPVFSVASFCVGFDCWVSLPSTGCWLLSCTGTSPTVRHCYPSLEALIRLYYTWPLNPLIKSPVMCHGSVFFSYFITRLYCLIKW